MSLTAKLTNQEIAAAGLTGWTLMPGGIRTRLRTKDFRTGMQLLASIGEVAEEMDHHPDLDLRYPHLDVRLTSHDAGGVTERDITLAHRVTELASALGVELSNDVVTLELALDTPDRAAISPFWAAVWAGEAKGDDIVDRTGSLPLLWFQQSGTEEPRQRWHPDIWVDPEHVQSRIDAAVAAGGSLVTDEHAPSFWVLADPEGNKVCLCTWQERTSSA
jgi:4a-hydroxytetrahydrobiopterin dehydratase